LTTTPELSAVRGELALELGDHLVEGGIHVVTGPLRPEDVPGGVARDLDVVASSGSGVALDDLDLQASDARIDPAELAELVLGYPSDLVGDADAPALEDEIQSSSLPRHHIPTRWWLDRFERDVRLPG